MATYTPASRQLPSQRRSVLITVVAAGDQIDFIDALGRPARGVILHVTDVADIVEYKLNNKLQLQKPRQITPNNSVGPDESVSFWATSSEYPTYSASGAMNMSTPEGLLIGSIEIVSLTLAVGVTIEITAW